MLPIEERVRERTIAIEPYLVTSPDERRRAAKAATALVVRSCWLLHIVLDFGSQEQGQPDPHRTRTRQVTAE